MLFNHSYEPIAGYDIHLNNETIEFFAYTDIKAGVGILINYNGDVDEKGELWFNKE